jgi:hypothetical protein
LPAHGWTAAGTTRPTCLWPRSVSSPLWQPPSSLVARCHTRNSNAHKAQMTRSMLATRCTVRPICTCREGCWCPRSAGRVTSMPQQHVPRLMQQHGFRHTLLLGRIDGVRTKLHMPSCSCWPKPVPAEPLQMPTCLSSPGLGGGGPPRRSWKAKGMACSKHVGGETIVVPRFAPLHSLGEADDKGADRAEA